MKNFLAKLGKNEAKLNLMNKVSIKKSLNSYYSFNKRNIIQLFYPDLFDYRI